MPFKTGTYKHEEGFTVMVTEDGVIMLSPNHPLSLRLSVLFDTTKWTKISQKGEHYGSKNKRRNSRISESQSW